MKNSLFSKSGFLLLFFLPAFVVADAIEDKDYSPYPQPDSGYVTDYANLLTKEEEERIEKWLWQVDDIPCLQVSIQAAIEI